MPDETEVKFAVETFDPLRRRVRRMGAEYLGTVVITDTYLDTPDQALLAGDRGLRLRQVRYLRRATRAGDDRPELTYKGPTVRTQRTKTRKEVQTRLDSADAALEILAACGVQPMLVIEKRRASYRLGPCRIEMDELPVIGRFAEIEGPDEPTIARLAEQLGLAGREITDHYVDLLRNACRRIGKPCREVTFEKCSPCQSK